jgi:hypothetical protein
MPATFAPITDRPDRPRLFDDRPSSRARRPARRQPPTPPRDPAGPPREPLFGPAPEPELIPREPDTTARGPLDSETAPAPHRDDRAPNHSRHGGGSLDELIRGVWDELASHRTVTCPVCHGQMAPRYGSAEEPVGGRCRRCGSSLG